MNELKEQLVEKLSARKIAHTPLGDTEILNAELIVNDLMQLIETYTAKECFKEVVGFAGTNHSNRKFCEHYEERYKYLKGKLDQLSSQLTNKEEQ